MAFGKDRSAVSALHKVIEGLCLVVALRACRDGKNRTVIKRLAATAEAQLVMRIRKRLRCRHQSKRQKHDKGFIHDCLRWTVRQKTAVLAESPTSWPRCPPAQEP